MLALVRLSMPRAVSMTAPAMSYQAFLEAKVCTAKYLGFDIDPAEVSPILKPHQRDIVVWAARGGCRAIFASFGLGKTMMQLELVRLVRAHTGGRGLIVIPLGVRQEFMRDAAILGITVTFIRSIDEASDPEGIYLTNYETVRDGKLDPNDFTVASLDEASVLRGFGGTKTFREFMRLFAGDDGGTGQSRRGVPFRFVATATPSPNEYIELLSYAAYLGIMQVSEAKTRFFKRDSTKADQLTIHPHKTKEFWLWVSSWALFIQRPSDLGYSDEGYELPPMQVQWHELPSDHTSAGQERDGQARIFADSALGVSEASREKRRSMEARVGKVMHLLSLEPEGDQPVVWCDLNDEQRLIEAGLTERNMTFSSLDGGMHIDEREKLVNLWRSHMTMVFVSKPVMYGAGVNLQQSHTMVFSGIGFKAQDIIQAVHRIHRFQQEHPCKIHFVYTESERGIRATLERKWRQHTAMVDQMAQIIREYGLAHAETSGLVRSIDMDRVSVSGDGYRLVNGDAIEEAKLLDADSVDLIITSIPFSTQYEYTPSYRDLGHTDDDAHFFEHLDYLTPELLRVLRPGRVAAIHVKDRIQPGGLTGLGFQTVSPFSDYAVAHFRKHGFAFLARKTIVTDVVRENNQTYRLGWTEQCKDGSRMGCGLPEYLLLFRKPPSDRSDGYADIPVTKSKAEYSRSRWQIDAHGFARSNGNRPLLPGEIADLPHDVIYKLFRKYSTEGVYDFEQHVALGEGLEAKGRLPVTFMLLPPASWHQDVWTDITRMRTLNGAQSAKGKEMHLCPLQFDIVDRVITQFSQKGETVLDPFGGLMTVPYCAIKLGRTGLGFELNPRYFADGLAYCEAAAQAAGIPTLFSLDEATA